MKTVRQAPVPGGQSSDVVDDLSWANFVCRPILRQWARLVSLLSRTNLETFHCTAAAAGGPPAMSGADTYAPSEGTDAPPPAGAIGIAAVERETGINKETLRVWERRYGFPAPWRDATGERLYPPEQVHKLRLVRRLMEAGIGEVVSLQFGPRAAELDDLITCPVGNKDFLDTARVLEDISVVVGVDTSALHLAGGLGRHGLVLLNHIPDFRWLLGRLDSPWYPTHRLLRQPSPRDRPAPARRGAEQRPPNSCSSSCGDRGTSTSASRPPRAVNSSTGSVRRCSTRSRRTSA